MNWISHWLRSSSLINRYKFLSSQSLRVGNHMFADIPGNNNSTSMESSTTCSTPANNIASNILWSKACQMPASRSMSSQNEAASVGGCAESVVARLKLIQYTFGSNIRDQSSFIAMIDQYTAITISIPLSQIPSSQMLAALELDYKARPNCIASVGRNHFRQHSFPWYSAMTLGMISKVGIYNDKCRRGLLEWRWSR